MVMKLLLQLFTSKNGCELINVKSHRQCVVWNKTLLKVDSISAHFDNCLIKQQACWEAVDLLVKSRAFSVRLCSLFLMNKK